MIKVEKSTDSDDENPNDWVPPYHEKRYWNTEMGKWCDRIIVHYHAKPRRGAAAAPKAARV